MGITIQADAGSEGGEVVPFPISVMLTCDEAGDIFCRGFETFRSPDGLIGARSDAVKAGWLERQSGAGGQWVCPRCRS